MLIIECTCRCKPGTRDQFLEIVKPNVEGSRKEKGNISYTPYPSPDNDVDMFVFEKWEIRKFSSIIPVRLTIRLSARPDDLFLSPTVFTSPSGTAK